jgi:excisionase family DNA binding protein
VSGEPLLLSVRQTARALGIGRDATYALIRQGRLPAIRIGRRLAVPRSALPAWVEEEARRQAEETAGSGGPP